MEAVAWHPFKARNIDELSFKKKDILKILYEATDRGYYQAELRGQTGIIPINHVEFEPPTWYMEIARAEASSILEEKDSKGSSVQPDGAFIVRPSSHSHGDIKLTVKFNDGVENLTIRTSTDGETFSYYIWEDCNVKFSSINKLVQYYRKNSIRRRCKATLNDLVTVKAKAKFDYRTTRDQELTFNKGDSLTVLSRGNPEWSLCEMMVRDCFGKRPVRGRVPVKYV